MKKTNEPKNINFQKLNYLQKLKFNFQPLKQYTCYGLNNIFYDSEYKAVKYKARNSFCWQGLGIQLNENSDSFCCPNCGIIILIKEAGNLYL